MSNVMTQDNIDALNAQMTDGKSAHDVAVENCLELIRWYDESGGVQGQRGQPGVWMGIRRSRLRRSG
jgi:hypothetical protein